MSAAQHDNGLAVALTEQAERSYSAGVSGRPLSAGLVRMAEACRLIAELTARAGLPGVRAERLFWQ
ncbi:MAG TPA: hypothetical protein VFQ44_30850, partial [Streptosporangiaceae bacterium]|nr:hypothetical protein [Streptosporangiaceae bacterium]